MADETCEQVSLLCSVSTCICWPPAADGISLIGHPCLVWHYAASLLSLLNAMHVVVDAIGRVSSFVVDAWFTATKSCSAHATYVALYFVMSIPYCSRLGVASGMQQRATQYMHPTLSMALITKTARQLFMQARLKRCQNARMRVHSCRPPLHACSSSNIVKDADPVQHPCRAQSVSLLVSCYVRSINQHLPVSLSSRLPFILSALCLFHHPCCQYHYQQYVGS